MSFAGLLDAPVKQVNLRKRRARIEAEPPSSFFRFAQRSLDDLTTFSSRYYYGATQRSGEEEQRVAYGLPATKGQFPFAVRLEIEKKNGKLSLCGGSLVSPKVVMTAAHCLYETDGSSKAKEITAIINDRIVHGESYFCPEFSPRDRKDYYADLALILLEDEVPDAEKSLVRLDNSSIAVTDNEIVFALGWGHTEEHFLSESLLYTDIPYISRKKFSKWIRDVSKKEKWLSGFEVEKDKIVAGLDKSRKDTCAGDSGGPLIMKKKNTWIQIGITSYGLVEVCGHDKMNIGMYTSVSHWKNWIADVLAVYNMNSDLDEKKYIRSNSKPISKCLRGKPFKVVPSSLADCCESCKSSRGWSCLAWSWSKSEGECKLFDSRPDARSRRGKCMSGYIELDINH